MRNYYINIDDICESLGNGFSREEVLTLYKNEGHFDFVIIDENPEIASGLISPVPLYHDKIDNLTNFSNIFASKENLKKYIQNNESYIRKKNESHQFPINFDRNSFSSHPFFVEEFQHAIQIWFDIYSTPSRRVYECNRNRKNHSMLISQHVDKGHSHLPKTIKENITLLINPIPEKNSPEINIEPLSEKHHHDPPLSINHHIANKCQFYPAELHIAIETWVTLFSYPPPNHKADRQKYETLKQYTIKWLNYNFPGFTNKAYDRIAVFLNIDKRNKTP